MSERSPETAEHRTRGPHELRVAVFDLSQRALVSPNYTRPALFQDFEPYNANVLLDVTQEVRATTIGRRMQERSGGPVPILPPMNTIGRMSTGGETPLTGYAVVARDPINFRDFSAGLRRYDMLDVYNLALNEVENPESTVIDIHDAQLLISGFKHVRELSRMIAQVA